MTLLITLEALQTLDAIEHRQSFAAAAEELHRVPSAVSYTINKLEEDLGVTLFDRSKRRAELTATGRLVLEQGRHILKAAEELSALARQAADGWEAELEVLTLDAPRPPVEISVAWRRSNTGKALKWFVDRLKQMQFDSAHGGLIEKH